MTRRALRTRTESVGRADSPGGTRSWRKVSLWPVQRKVSIPSGVSITTAPAGPERTTASISRTLPVAREVRRRYTLRPSDASIRLAGESSQAS